MVVGAYKRVADLKKDFSEPEKTRIFLIPCNEKFWESCYASAQQPLQFPWQYTIIQIWVTRIVYRKKRATFQIYACCLNS